MAMESAFRPAAVRPPILTGTEALTGAALGAAATGAGLGAAAATFAALTAAQRFFVAAIIARLPAALSFRFAGAVGPTVSADASPVRQTAVPPFDQDPTFSLRLSNLEAPRLRRSVCLARLSAKRGCGQWP
jgi:hypothetical protein